jgi:CBS domain-containing protein
MLSAGRVLGVELRVHIFFPVLLAVAMAYSAVSTGGIWRGIALWLALCFAVWTRETARALAAAYAGLKLRALYLLPIGGVMAFSLRDEGDPQTSARWITACGPIANFGMGLLLLVFSYAFDPHVDLLLPPWVSLFHILRSVIWIQIILGVVSLLPTPTMPTRQLLRSETPGTPPTGRSAGPAFSTGTGIALIMIVAGFLMPQHYWLIIAGGFMLLSAQMTGAQAVHTGEAESILVREIMLTEYTLLSSSDTLRGALDQTVHSLQDVFPVVRGDQFVGTISRKVLATRLLTEGDTYLQGLMSRTIHVATPAEPLVDALRRCANLGASEFIPVVEDGALVGVLTPASLGRAVQQVKLIRPTPTPREQS